ncbi:transport protein Avl9-domain-containing protein, partial [Sphaerosporella brunnea]
MCRGPEVEHWIGVESENDISDWPLLPFLALTDGAHSSSEDFSYFTLKHTRGDSPTTLFGISCTRQLDSRQLIERPADVTRSTPHDLLWASEAAAVRGHASMVRTKVVIMVLLNLPVYYPGLHLAGLSLREFIYEFKHQALVLFKCMLLQPKMLFFGTRGDRLCMTQFSLVSLIPGLLRNLQDSSDPELYSYESMLVKPTSVRSSDRKSLLTFMGLPLQIFGKGSLFGPYTPLQMLDVLSDAGTKSYIVGSTNSLLLQQRDRYSDILINMEDMAVTINSPSLRTALSLSAADRRWIDSLVLSVTDSWDEADPSRPKTLGFVGSEDYIRLQFEEYILSMVSAVKYHLFLEKHAGSDLNVFLPDIEGDPSVDFNADFVDYWKKTDNFRIFQTFTEPEIFDLVPPKHVMAGGLTVEDVQRRIAQQVHELGLDEKVSAGKEAVVKAVANGRNNLSLAFTNLSKNVEQYREQRRLQSQQQNPTQSTENSTPGKSSVPSTAPTSPISTDAPSKASAYFSSWAYWAGEKKKKLTETPGSPEPSP